MELNQDNLFAENKKLQARINVLEESRNSTTIRHIIDRLDNVIRMENHHETDNCQVGQSINDIQQEVIALRQTVDAWNEEDPQPIQDPASETHKEINTKKKSFAFLYMKAMTQLMLIHQRCRLRHPLLALQQQSLYPHSNCRCLKEAIVCLFEMLICFSWESMLSLTGGLFH